jgi:hypothetical protein
MNRPAGAPFGDASTAPRGADVPCLVAESTLCERMGDSASGTCRRRFVPDVTHVTLLDPCFGKVQLESLPEGTLRKLPYKGHTRVTGGL